MSSLCSPRIEGMSCPRRRSSWRMWDHFFNHRILCFGYFIFSELNILIITTNLPICMRLHVRHSVMTASPVSPPSTSSADSAPKIKFAKEFSKVLKLHWKHHYCTSSRCRLCSNLIYNHLKCFIIVELLFLNTQNHTNYIFPPLTLAFEKIVRGKIGWFWIFQEPVSPTLGYLAVKACWWSVIYAPHQTTIMSLAPTTFSKHTSWLKGIGISKSHQKCFRNV